MLKSKKLLIYLLAVVLILLFAAGLFLFLKPASVGVADAAAEPLVNNGVYMLRNKASGLYLSYDYLSLGFGLNIPTTINQKTFNGDFNQQFILRTKNYIDWEIMAKNGPISNPNLDVEGGSSAVNTSIIPYNKNNSVNQLFKFQKNSDGTYRILTKVSNYSYALGIIDDSKNTDAQCAQIYSFYSTTSWYLEKIWDKSNLGMEYGLENNALPKPPSHPIFGSPFLEKDELVYDKFVTASHPIQDNRHESFKSFYIRYWKYSQPFNGQLHAYSRLKMLNPGDSVTYSRSVTESATKTNENSITYSLSASLNHNTGAEIPLNIFKLNSKFGGMVSGSISKTMKYSESYTYQITDSESITHKNNSSSTEYVQCESRGNIYFYFIQVFYFNYNESTHKKLLWTYHNYTLKNQMAYDEIFSWKLDNSTITDGINPYLYDTTTHKYTYNGYRNPGVIYI